MSHSALIDRLQRRTGLDRESIGTTALDHCIDEACVALGCSDASALLAMVDGSERDWQRFVDCMVVPETWFFRVPEQFEDLQRYARNELTQRRPIRILSLPCASGEEVYSILSSLLSVGFSLDSMQVLGIDISARLIERARAASYGRHALRGRAIDSQWFHWEGDRLQPAPNLCRAAQFRVGNALHPGLFGSDERFDVIFCRNLLIYLDPESRLQVISQLISVLEPPGLILAGQAEALSTMDSRLQPLAGYGPLSYSVAARAPRLEPTAPVWTHSAKIRPAAPAIARSEGLARAPIAATAADATLAREQALQTARRAADAGHLQQAQALCTQLLQQHPEWAEAWFLSGVIEAAVQNFDAAEAAFVRVGYLDRDNREALAHRAALAERRGRSDEAGQLRSRLRRMEQGSVST